MDDGLYMDEAFALVESKADPAGRWLLEDSFNDRFAVPVEVAGEPSRWVTLAALEVLAHRAAAAR